MGNFRKSMGPICLLLTQVHTTKIWPQVTRLIQYQTRSKGFLNISSQLPGANYGKSICASSTGVCSWNFGSTVSHGPAGCNRCSGCVWSSAPVSRKYKISCRYGGGGGGGGYNIYNGSPVICMTHCFAGSPPPPPPQMQLMLWGKTLSNGREYSRYS